MILKALLWIWSMRLFRRRLWNIPTNGQKEKWENMNKLTIRFLCSNLIKDEIIATALTFWLDFLESPYMSSSKVSLSFFFPKNFSLHVLESFSLQISTWWLFFSSKKKVKFIWIYFHTVILKPQSKAFRHTLNFFNFLQFWTLQIECYQLHDLLSRYLV